MFNKLAGKILFRWFHFTETITEPLPEKCIIALAPHTSNWDFIVGNLYSRAKGFHCDFLMKKEWFFWPMGILMRRLGGIPVYRSKQMHSTDIIAEQAKQAAEIPILLYGLDFAERKIVCTKTIIPNGDIEAQMKEIKDYYANFKGLHPKQFIIL